MKKELLENRPKMPKRAIVTSGMPNGNKEMHVGHICIFIWADVLNRFLKDAIGKENVIFVSSTDSYGSMVVEKYRKWKEDGFDGTISDVVKHHHEINKSVLDSYKVGYDSFGADCLDPLKSVHAQVSEEVFDKLLKNGEIKKVGSQIFYDEELKMFLNGRQVLGRCPIDGCKSEEAYADECALGHQYSPNELIDPISKLSGTKPVLKESFNYYFDLPKYFDYLTDITNSFENRVDIRRTMLKEMKGFLGKPSVFIHETSSDLALSIKDKLPPHSQIKEKDKLSFVFESVEDREFAVAVLMENAVRFRTGKAIVPLRITGNSEWGIPVPKVNDDEPRTFYVWPESLWEPISSTILTLKNRKSDLNWQDFWCDDENGIYQFIGEDNIYFYTLCEPALFKALDWNITLPTFIANKYVTFGNAKASSSGKIKAITGREALTKYTYEQLRMHLLGQSLGVTSYEFKSKAFNPELFGNEEDTMLREGNILTNIFNRIVRSVFYTTAKYFGGVMPFGEVSESVYDESVEALLNFEKNMMTFDINKNITIMDLYFRNANKNWARIMTETSKTNDVEAIRQVVIDTLFVVKTGIMLLHSIAPDGAELVCEKLRLNNSVFEWKNIFAPIYDFVEDKNNHQITQLEPKYDFFKKHDSQFN